jgi:broad specificity phosphatase PhoE/predicted kinase
MEAKATKRIFIKFGPDVKRVDLPTAHLASLRDLASLFLTKFELPSELLAMARAGQFPLYIQDRQSQVWYEMENIDDVYESAVVELRKPNNDNPMGSSRGGHKIEYCTSSTNDKLVFVMCGLPARGKTYIARKISRYLNWLGVPTQVFNVGSYRREKLGAKQPPEFFDPTNPDGSTQRLHMAVLALDDMFEWLRKGGRVGIYDATNSTKSRRQLIMSRCTDEHIQVIFIESICEDPVIIESTLRETKLHSPDFEGVPSAEAIQQFQERIEHYTRAYETVDEDEYVSFIKMFDVGKKIIVHNLPSSYLPGRVVFFLMNLHIIPRPIFLTRHGQSMDNTEDKIGGDSKLTPSGERYAQALSSWVNQRIFEAKAEGKKKSAMERTVSYDGAEDKLMKLTVWTSTLQRAIATSQYLPQRKIQLRCLDEIDAGKCDGMTYEEIAKKMPEEFAARAADKLRYRYPQGESYEDVIQRLEPIIFELERQRDPVLVIAHNAVIRCLYAYFKEKPADECPHIDVPLHTLIELTPRAYGCEEKRYALLKKDDAALGRSLSRDNSFLQPPSPVQAKPETTSAPVTADNNSSNTTINS